MKICPVCATQYTDDVRFCPNDGQTLGVDAPASDLVGQVIADRYHVVEKLGEGGMGQVYRADHVRIIGRKVAIKVMNPAMVHDAAAIARFNREAANASKINHPNVCTIYDFGETPEGLIYLAMAYVEGESLARMLEGKGVLPLNRAGRIFAQVAQGVQAAHDLGIVHRDLKPDNIMVSRGRDGRDVVTVVDFGIAKAVGAGQTGQTGQTVTKAGIAIGTPEFMSPEQVSGGRVDGRSDLYSLALVLYRMLTGRLPFQARTVQEMIIKRVTEPPATLRRARPDLTFPEGLQRIFDKALAHRPADRYQRVADFAAAVGALTAPGLRPRPKKKTPSRLRLVPGAAALVVAIVVTITLLPQPPPPLVDNTTNGHPGEGGKPQNPAGGGAATKPAQPSGNDQKTPGARHSPAIDPVRAPAALDALFEAFDARTLRATAIRDSARHIYEGVGVTDKDRAFAAYIAALALARLEDRTGALDWARRAERHDPASRAYRQLVLDLTRSPP